MDPLTIGLGIVSIGMQLFGGAKASQEAQHQAQLAQQNFQLETQVNAQRKQAMELSASRQQIENYRNVRRSQAMGLSSATSQGAYVGNSGVQGGQAQASAQGTWNDVGIAQNLTIGRNIFGLNDEISANKAQMSQSQSRQATDQGWANLGTTIGKNAGTISNIASFGSTQFGNMFSGGSSFDFSTGGVPAGNRLSGGVGSA